MRLSSKDFRTLQEAAGVADAQQGLIDLAKGGRVRSWHAQAGLIAIASAVALGLAAIGISDSALGPTETPALPQVLAQLDEPASTFAR